MPKPEFDQHVVVPPRCAFHSVAVWVTPQRQQSMTDNKLKNQFWYQSLQHCHMQGELDIYKNGRDIVAAERRTKCGLQCAQQTDDG